MVNYDKIESVLVADCGSNLTRVALVEVVELTYRFVARGEAPTTLEAPYHDVTGGVIAAIRAIETSTGRRLLLGGKLILPQHADGSGVDAFIASSSAAAPLRIVTASLTKTAPEPTSTAINACYSTYCSLAGSLSLDDKDRADFNPFFKEVQGFDRFDPAAQFTPFDRRLTEPPELLDTGAEGKLRPSKPKKSKPPKVFNRLRRRAWRVRQVTKLRRLRPDILVITGATRKTKFKTILKVAEVALEAARQSALEAEAEARTAAPMTLVFAGSPAQQAKLLEKVNQSLEVFMADEAGPKAGGHATLHRQLAALYRERALPGLPGYRELSELSRTPVVPTCEATGLITRFLAKDTAGNHVLTADLGGSSISLFYADEQDFQPVVRGNYGLSFGLSNILAENSLEDIRRWLSFEISDDELVHYALNKTLRPQTIPATERELFIEGAFARQALAGLLPALNSQRPALNYNRLVGTGGPLVNLPLWQAALLLLDGLQPAGATGSGLVELEMDSTMLMAACGTLAHLSPNAAAYLFQYDCLHRLGAALVVQGEGRPGEVAAQITLSLEDGRTSSITARWGSLAYLPLRSGERAKLEIELSRGFRVGHSQPGALVSTRPGQELAGGALGLIIDARGRPVSFETDAAARCRQVAEWYNAYRSSGRIVETATTLQA